MSQHQNENIRPGMMIKTREFWILWLTFFLNTQSIGYINAMYKVMMNFGLQLNAENYFLIFIVEDFKHFLIMGINNSRHTGSLI